MKLVEFSVTNYRSITSAHKIALKDLTVLVGKNNEGKSNLLKGLDVAMNAVILHGRSNFPAMARKRMTMYRWERDFPLQYQERKSGLESIFRLNFRLNETETQELHVLTGLRGNEDIPIEVKIGKDCIPRINVPKRGSPSYKSKSEQLTDFISKRIAFNYIQAIRTDSTAIGALKNIIANELGALEEEEEYVQAWEKIETLEQNVLDAISEGLVEPLRVFLPTLRSVEIIKKREYYYEKQTSNFIDVIIDDGLATSISNKGDGIKSLVALAILKERKTTSGASIIAIEEPESHLHSGAIHSLVEVIQKISENSQVIITTHNPLFVQQNSISSNIIVDNGTARTAKSVAEIRNILGVLPSDNLRNARYVLVVEGEDDKIILNKILPLYSESIKNALKSNTLIIKSLGGVGNLNHDLLDLKHSLCQYVVLLDNDKAGVEAAKNAMSQGLLTTAQVRHTICNGLPEAELEDCIKPALYENVILNTFSVSIKVKDFKCNNKWSDRMKSVFLSNGIRWTDQVEKQLKLLVAEAIPLEIESIEKILITQKSGFINGLVMAIENMIGATK